MTTIISTGLGTPVSSEKRWKAGYGVIKHTAQTQARIRDMIAYLTEKNLIVSGVDPYEVLAASDVLASASMWLTVHSTYANNVYLDGRLLVKDDFKSEPEGHTGGSLNVLPGYVGYLTVNTLMGKTRAWMMEQGHAVAAVDSVNILVGNMKAEHAKRYNYSDEGLSKFCQDFYSFKINAQGHQESPRGSHVNHNTAGGFLEGGYLGFASVQYVHIPLPHERLVAFLSDGAFEEQKGGDWAPRFWRAEDCGLVMPIMIFNGRRIDQSSTMSKLGGAEWLASYLRIHNFDPVIFDGRDPAAFTWAIFEMEHRLKRYIKALESPNSYPVKLPYGIAVAPKGAGFYGEGTNAAHNLPLVDNPYLNDLTRERFNYHASRLWVPEPTLKRAVSVLNNHELSGRIREKDHAIANRKVSLENHPDPVFKPVSTSRENMQTWTHSCPMEAIDKGFITLVKANPKLRARVGNPDEIRSNKMNETLEYLKFRSENPEGGNYESISGGVITALNEEAVAGVVFGNKGGINISVTYEAFGAKMFGEARQEVIFAQHLKESKQPAQWLSVPIILASHAWENGKNEQSHQDPSMAESMYGEMSDISRVLFPPDYNTSAVTIHECYKSHGQVWTVVVSKRGNPDIFTKDESYRLFADGAIRLGWAEHKPSEAKVCLMGIGAYQMTEILRASQRLRTSEVPFLVSCVLEPGRFRNVRSINEKEHAASESVRKAILPEKITHVSLIVHTRPEIIAGSLSDWFSGMSVSQFGFTNHGGTLDSDGLLFVNQSSWAHIVRDVARALGIDEKKLLSQDEIDALDNKRSPDGVIRGIW